MPMSPRAIRRALALQGKLARMCRTISVENYNGLFLSLRLVRGKLLEEQRRYGNRRKRSARHH